MLHDDHVDGLNHELGLLGARGLGFLALGETGGLGNLSSLGSEGLDLFVSGLHLRLVSGVLSEHGMVLSHAHGLKSSSVVSFVLLELDWLVLLRLFHSWSDHLLGVSGFLSSEGSHSSSMSGSTGSDGFRSLGMGGFAGFEGLHSLGMGGSAGSDDFVVGGTSGFEGLHSLGMSGSTGSDFLVDSSLVCHELGSVFALLCEPFLVHESAQVL